jgi:hypothetical protein
MQGQPVAEWDGPKGPSRPGDVLWLQSGGSWPTDAYIGRKIASPDRVRREVARKWGAAVTLYHASYQQVWKTGGEEWIASPFDPMPQPIRTRVRGKRQWASLADLERYVLQAAIEDPTLVRYLEDAHVVVVGTMDTRRDPAWGTLRVDRVLAVRDPVNPVSVGDTVRFGLSPEWMYDVRSGEPMLWCLQKEDGGFAFVGMEDQPELLKLMRRKGWRVLPASRQQSSASATTPGSFGPALPWAALGLPVLCLAGVLWRRYLSRTAG